MKKQLLLGFLATGLIGSHIQAIGINDVSQALKNRNLYEFAEMLETYFNTVTKEEDILQDLEYLFASGISITNNLYSVGFDYTESADSVMLGYALEQDKYKVANFLLDHGVDINKRIDGGTLLIIFAEAGDFKAVQFLLDHGADVMATDEEGKTVFDLINDKNQDQLVQEFLEEINQESDYPGYRSKDLLTDYGWEKMLNRLSLDNKQLIIRMLLENHLKKAKN